MSKVQPITIRRRVRRGDHSLRLRATAFPISKAHRSDTSRQTDDDSSFAIDSVAASRGLILSTPFNLQSIASIFERSNTLRQCVYAYITNIVSYGYRVVKRHETIEMDADEKEILESWIRTANPDESLVSVARHYLYDYERFGFGFFEVIRNNAGQPTLLKYAKSATTRVLRKDEKLVTVETEMLRGKSRRKVTERRRFRRYVQQPPNSKQRVYFKEMGDPRIMDWRDGKFQGEEGKGRVRPQYRATELIHGKQFSDEPYGIPRWISQLPNILGSREAEEVNLRFFEDNTVPPMMLLVSGGRLTGNSFKELQDLLSGAGLGGERQNQILLIEAVPETTALDERGNVTLSVEKLTSERQSDGLFQTYDDANQAKVQSSFRLPNTLVGKSQDVTFATANVSAFIAETQVFLPERQVHDELLNKRLINATYGLNLGTVKLESRGPQITNPEQIVKTLTAANVMGALTPRAAVDALNEALQMFLPQYPKEGEEDYEEWMDTPVSITLRTIGRGSPDSTREEQDTDTDEIRETQESGATGPRNPEHGSE